MGIKYNEIPWNGMGNVNGIARNAMERNEMQMETPNGMKGHGIGMQMEMESGREWGTEMEIQ